MFDPVGRGKNVLEIAAAHIEQIGLLKFFTVARRATIVRRDHHVALIHHVLNEPVKQIDCLRSRAAVDENNGRVLAIAPHIVWHIEQRRDRPLAVATGIMHE